MTFLRDPDQKVKVGKFMSRRILRPQKRKPGDLTSEDLHQGEMFEKDIE